MSEWISVKDRLPEDNKRILVYVLDNGTGCICFYHKPKNLNNPRLVWHKITHWMPLPETPK